MIFSDFQVKELDCKDSLLKELNPHVERTILSYNQEDAEDCDAEKQSIFNDIHLNRFKSRNQLINTWEGTVTDVDGKSIFAKLYDTSDGTFDEFEFEFNDLKDSDQNMVKEGALFFLYLGYYTDNRGTKMKSSNIEFRRFPTNLDEDDINEKLDAIDALNFDDLWE